MYHYYLLLISIFFWIISGYSYAADAPNLKPRLVTGPHTSDAEPKSRQGGRLVICYGGTPIHFNPAIASGTPVAMPGAQLFASPLRYDENWDPKPYLAKSWEVSGDGLAVTLHLVEGATFHDGHPITSDDVAFSVMLVKEYHPFKSMFKPVLKVDTPDVHTAVIRLSSPHPAIMLAMSPALLPILPKHVYGDGHDIKTHPANLAPVGSGPFKLVAYTPGKTIVLKRYDDYFIPGRPYLDEIIIRLEDDPKAEQILMERQEVHMLPGLTDFDGIDRLSSKPYISVTSHGFEAVGPLIRLDFNLLRKPLNDKRVRQAIAYAMDLDFITQYLHQGRSERAPGPIVPASPFYSDKVRKYTLDLDKASQLLDAAGYPLKPGGTRLTITLDYLPAMPSQQEDVALYLRRQLAKIGIEVQIRTSASFPEWAKRSGNWDFDMTLDFAYNWGDPVIGVGRLYLSDNIRKGVVWSNTQNYRNPTVDELLNKAGQEMDVGKRKSLYAEFQQIVAEDLPIIWINVVPYHNVYNKGLGNPPLSIWGIHSPLDKVYWKTLPKITSEPLPPLSGKETPLQTVALRALSLLHQQGIYGALETLSDPGQGFLDLQATGLHVIGFTHQGTIFLDNSGQTKPGMDIRDILDLKGNKVLPQLLAAADHEGGSLLTLQDFWPNPATQTVSPLSVWCVRLSPQDVVCAMKWSH